MDQKKRAVNPLLRLVPPAQPCQDGDGDFGLVCDHEFRVGRHQSHDAAGRDGGGAGGITV